tara:strand:- start:9093 stop:9602 length:510 start_codon:yes stop_codon:yes gene_type:complete
MSHPDHEVLEEHDNDSFYPGKIERAPEGGGVLGAETNEATQLEPEVVVGEAFQMEPQPGFTSARRSEPNGVSRARPHRSRPSRLDCIDALDFADYDSESPKQVALTLLPSDLKLIDDLRSKISGEHAQELTGGEVVRLALRCFQARPAGDLEQKEFRPQTEESSMILTS